MKQNKLIYGTHSLLEALEAGKEIDKIFIRRGLKTEETQRITAIARERIIPVQSRSEEHTSELQSLV